MSLAAETSPLLFNGPDWDFDLIRRVNDACGEIALREMNLDIYESRIEVIVSCVVMTIIAFFIIVACAGASPSRTEACSGLVS